MRSTKWPMLSSISEKCQLWTHLTERFKSNPSRAQARARWEKMDKCIPSRKNLATKLNAIMVIANKSNVKMENAKKEILMLLISKILNNFMLTDLDTLIHQTHKPAHPERKVTIEMP